ncbi:type II toxin-antitoxin system PemK/MazF family toxin [Parvimonas parva]|uniref:mRNA interferase n=1 Tax=Parvimonas parva TaxID=2769485 RepID=A0ABS1CAW8_9FIRM|nr:type II toxin-antitoxin system PemK/MazF family toxin [Parvimonas parva]MBK1469210.1 type II toxin-antitoxin system PemK/MazF family toxin [Parvimonas parva]
MVNQGDIIKINFNPNKGHEQAGYRPVLVVSNNFFNEKTKLAIVCPITNTIKDFPLHINLKNTKTTGTILCEHIRTLDIEERGYKKIEKVSEDILKKVLELISYEIQLESEI